MAKGRRNMPMGGGGMGNMNNMLKQAQKMQKEMEKMQEEMAEKEIESTSGGGAVKIVINGKKEVIELKISEEVVDPEDIEMLQDLIIAALNEAMRKVDETTNSEMGKLTGGMNIPGLF